ncbi:MAG: hypothetical protein VYA34_08685 [Myxococcota bacterium]|nr:hypothetical protein [Myxococcota bacterium]
MLRFEGKSIKEGRQLVLDFAIKPSHQTLFGDKRDRFTLYCLPIGMTKI